MKILAAAAALAIGMAPAFAADATLEQKKCLLEASQKLGTTYPAATVKGVAFGPAPAGRAAQPGETASSVIFALQVVDVPVKYAFLCLTVQGRGTVVQPIGVTE